MKLIDGKAIAHGITEELRRTILQLKGDGITPGLAVVLVGDDPASRAYVRSKDKMCQSLGMHSTKHELPVATTHDELVRLLRVLNTDPQIHGILVQSPLPAHIDERRIFEAIDPRKDVDGFHSVNVAKLALGETNGFVPCTPLGCQRLLLETGIEVAGAHVVVLGRSSIVG
jgi:methylenetetrahydrofolate dehydrogenase (NADP+)/methenyltetrahydrofolate cyclohydrolase